MTLTGLLPYITIDRIIAVIAIGVCVYLYLKNKREKLPVCRYLNTTLEPRKLPLSKYIKILYGEKELDRITRTRLILWNNGRESIQKSDIRGLLEIKLEPSAEVLESYVVKCSREVTGFRVTPIVEVGGKLTNRVNVTFDFLDKGDGASIEILHTGAEDTKPTFEGGIIGVPQGIIVKKVSPASLQDLTSSVVLPVVFFVMISTFGTLWEKGTFWSPWLFILMGIFLLFYFLFIFIFIQKLAAPKNLR